MWRIPYVNLGAQFAEERAELMPRIEAILASGMHVGGPEIEALEREIADYVGTSHAVALNSGTDALIFGMIAAGIGTGDEVITPPNSFVASTAAIVRTGATPVFADVRRDGLIDPEAVTAAVTPRTAAIMPVHLWGGVCDMEALWAIAERHGLAIVEDAAQAMGTRYRNRRAGSLGTVGCFSAHPLKIFNALGDFLHDLAAHLVQFGLLRRAQAELVVFVERRRLAAAPGRPRLNPRQPAAGIIQSG